MYLSISRFFKYYNQKAYQYRFIEQKSISARINATNMLWLNLYYALILQVEVVLYYIFVAFASYDELISSVIYQNNWWLWNSVIV